MLRVFSTTARNSRTDLNFCFAVERSILALFSHAIKDTQSVPKSEILVAEMIFTSGSKSKNRYGLTIVLPASLGSFVGQDTKVIAIYLAYYQIFGVYRVDLVVSSRCMGAVTESYNKQPKEKHRREHHLLNHSHK